MSFLGSSIDCFKYTVRIVNNFGTSILEFLTIPAWFIPPWGISAREVFLIHPTEIYLQHLIKAGGISTTPCIMCFWTFLQNFWNFENWWTWDINTLSSGTGTILFWVQIQNLWSRALLKGLGNFFYIPSMKNYGLSEMEDNYTSWKTW